MLLSSKAASSSAAVARRSRPLAGRAPVARRLGLAPPAAATTHKVTLEHDGKETVLEVEDGYTILEAAVDAGLDLPADCRMGVCFACAAKIDSGEVEQGAGTLSEDVIAKGYALLCVSTPRSDARVRTIAEDELLDQQLVAGNQ